MIEFVDGTGATHTIQLDAFILEGVRKETGLNDVAEWIASLESDPVVVVKSIRLMASSHEPLQKFAKRVTGDRIEEAAAAVRGAAELFFPQSKWSAIQSNLQKRQEAEAMLAEIRPMLRALDEMPEAMRTSVMAAVAEKLESIGSLESTGSPSASSQDTTHANTASDSQDSLELTHAN